MVGVKDTSLYQIRVGGTRQDGIGPGDFRAPSEQIRQGTSQIKRVIYDKKLQFGKPAKKAYDIMAIIVDPPFKETDTVKILKVCTVKEEKDKNLPYKFVGAGTDLAWYGGHDFSDAFHYVTFPDNQKVR